MVSHLARSLYIILIFCGLIKAAPASEVATVYTSYFPRIMVDNPDRPGVGYEIVAEIFKLAELEFKTVPLPWARAQHMVKRTPESLIFPLSWTPTRDKDYIWRVNIFNNKTHFITFNKTKLTPEAAYEKRIGVQLKSSWDNWLTEQGYKNLYRVPDEGMGLIKLLRNDRIDAWYTSKTIADSAIKELDDPDITYSDPIQVFKTYLATSKAAPYPHLDKLDAAMKMLRQSGRLAEIFKKYDLSFE